MLASLITTTTPLWGASSDDLAVPTDTNKTIPSYNISGYLVPIEEVDKAIQHTKILFEGGQISAAADILKSIVFNPGIPHQNKPEPIKTLCDLDLKYQEELAVFLRKLTFSNKQRWTQIEIASKLAIFEAYEKEAAAILSSMASDETIFSEVRTYAIEKIWEIGPQARNPEDFVYSTTITINMLAPTK